MKKSFAIAAMKEGIDKTKTTVIALADGAKNCWSVLESLAPLCLTLICILDWFHIGKYVQRTKQRMPEHTKQLDEIKNLLFHGGVEDALQKVKKLSSSLAEEQHVKLIDNFFSVTLFIFLIYS